MLDFVNPYGAPAERRAASAASGRDDLRYVAHNTELKWGYLAFTVFEVVCMVSLFAVPKNLAEVLVWVIILASVGRAVVVATWIYGMWSAIPHEYRRTANGTRVDPVSAIGLMFVPLYNLYWMFVISVGACEAFNRLHAEHDSPSPAPRELAVAACVLHLVPCLNVFAPVLWFVYMYQFDAAATELEERCRA